MAPKNTLAKITDAAQGAATLPLKVTEKVADRAVGVVAGGVRVTSSVIHATAERAKSMVGVEAEQDTPAAPDAPVGGEAKSSGSSTPAPGPATAPPAVPLESVEALAEAAVAREMAQEPPKKPTPSKAARATARTKTPKPDDEPLIDPATAKAVKSETDILRAAADVDEHL